MISDYYTVYEFMGISLGGEEKNYMPNLMPIVLRGLYILNKRVRVCVAFSGQLLVSLPTEVLGLVTFSGKKDTKPITSISRPSC